MHADGEIWGETLWDLRNVLGSATTESSGTVPEHCRSEQDFMRCLEAQQVALQYKWTWAGGESIEMTVGKPKPTDHATIRLVYRRSASANLSAL